ncbi:MAG: gamma-glutamyl-gamma-aminobutyrate hydrolase family protein, partial [Eubacteriaceae bacterium]|nr:gamma-glutamyl-gamma-aminobutyrate hydrolase family protein [Eubacteriaceae bacterium]
CQLINVAMGGSLIQDIPTFGIENIDHYQKTDGAEPFHTVAIEKDSLLYSIIGKESLQVNSFHHQAVKDPSPKLRFTAFAPDGIAEAVEGTGGPFLLGVQWHPEHMSFTDAGMMNIFRAFVSEAKK